MMDFKPDSGADVADSTDWLGTSLACLMPVEQAFRCHVCKDFFDAPMITSCNHTFCSLCIRRCLSVDGKCPLCRMSDQESKLRGNWALREAIDAFCQARGTILSVARTPPRAPSPPSATRRRSISPPKRKAEGDGPETSRCPSDDGHYSKRTRTSARLSKTKAAEAVASMAEEDTFDDAAWQKEERQPEDADYRPDDGLVECPICLKRMKPFQVDRHLDTSCPGVPQPQKTTHNSGRSTNSFAGTFMKRSSSALPSAVPRPPPERLPSISYSLLTDSALRKKMTALGLSHVGPRQLLERRHKEYTTLWNANCDSKRPKGQSDLLRDMDIWERTVGGGSSSGTISIGSLGGGSSGSGGGMLASRTIMAAASQQVAQIRDKDFDAEAWSTKHSTSFRDLVANARRSRQKQQDKQKEAAKEEEDKKAGAKINSATEPAPPPLTPLNVATTPSQTLVIDLSQDVVNSELTTPAIKPSDSAGVPNGQKQLQAEVAEAHIPRGDVEVPSSQ